MNFISLVKQFGSSQCYKKKSYVFSQGDKDSYIYLVLEGVLKACYYDKDGKEYIKSFLFSGDSIASSQALSGGSCSFSLCCLKEAKLLKLSYQQVRQAADTNLEFASSIIDLLMSFAMKKEQREFELLCLSAEQRYKKLLTKSPNISEQITQNDIARYLGITPVALSRIKHKPR
ncbi:Crp/Fnr family transcriptional regulator [Colwellia sp. TT2012]|uniref:Crp/Fnr family transcriptional regulator n=1 Tax=Colwellia sp. TT2012 TaxID=1720342 RepID=UPI00070CE247|nr:Crp/Fnr family transcriptional regulator [Colwellia sp. TT2012]